MSEIEENNPEDSLTQSELSETKSSSPTRKAESSPQNSGAIPKTGARSKSGGVKLGSFRLGGKKKATVGSPDRNQDEKRASKKVRKGKSKDESKPESDQIGECRHSIPSKATSLVRKLSIGKHRTGSGKLVKSASGLSSQDDSSVISKNDISTEDDRFSTASSSTTGGRPSLEEGMGIVADEPTGDVKTNRSEQGIIEPREDDAGGTISADRAMADVHSVCQTDSDTTLLAGSASPEFEEDVQESIASYAPIIHSPPCIENEQLARLEILLSKGYSNEVSEAPTKGQILQITTPLLNKHAMEEAQSRVPDVAQHGHNNLVRAATASSKRVF